MANTNRHEVKVNGEDMSHFYGSDVFNEDWFGPMGTTQADHYSIPSGWAADVTVDPTDWDMDPDSVRVTNAYGLMRSPWNIAKDKRVLRSNLTFGYASGYKGSPRCSFFYKVV
jgi:hypothetical protein